MWNLYNICFKIPLSHSRKFCRSINLLETPLSSELKVEIEKKWMPKIAKLKNLKKEGRPYYVLSMFPYPSGMLHMGHVRVYTISDTIAHFHRISGWNVIHPIGWDAFGLPAENAAIEHNISPNEWTKNNVEKMKTQLKSLGCCFDWEREINTSSPAYYKWTQNLFLELFKAGLVYKSEACVNWDPVDQTVLADEQVDEKGHSWRSGAKVEKKILNQWFIKTRKFAKDLYDELDSRHLEDWDDIIKLQKHWIGECNGTIIEFPLKNKDNENVKMPTLSVWTERPEILPFAKFIAIPSTHLLNKKYHTDPDHKELSVEATNPLNGECLKVVVTDDLPYPDGADSYLGSPDLCDEDHDFMSNNGILYDASKSVNRMTDENKLQLRKTVCDFLQQHNLGGYPVSSKLKDWLISRQRYWGTPIPVVYCDECGTVPVPADELPVVFPTITVQGKIDCMNELKRLGWLNTTCPTCKKQATREADTMDTFVDSSWYFLRYLDPNNIKEPFDPKSISKSFPVDIYIGGKEHAVLHLYYARFFTHFLYSIGRVNVKEPFTRLLVQGMIMGKTYKIQESGKYIPKSQVKIIDENKKLAVTINDNKKVKIIWEKMSKSKYNGEDPSALLEKYGCDTTRLFVLCDVSPKSSKNWSEAAFAGVLNWQNRVWSTVSEFINCRESELSKPGCESLDLDKFNCELCDARNRHIVHVTYNYAHTYNFNVVISRLQALTKLLKSKSSLTSQSIEYEKCLGCLIIMIAPMAPHFASELWNGFVNAPGRIDQSNSYFLWDRDVFEQTWPVVDPDYNLHLTCKINGNEMGQIPLKSSLLNQLTESIAMDYIFNNDKVGNKVKKQFIARTSLDVYTNCFAVFNFVMDYKIKSH